MSRLLHGAVDFIGKGGVVERFCSLHGQQQVVDIADVTFGEYAPAKEIGFGVEFSIRQGFDAPVALLALPEIAVGKAGFLGGGIG